MSPGGRRASPGRLLALLVLLLVCIVLLWRLFIAVPAAPRPRITRSGVWSWADMHRVTATHVWLGRLDRAGPLWYEVMTPRA